MAHHINMDIQAFGTLMFIVFFFGVFIGCAVSGFFEDKGRPV